MQFLPMKPTGLHDDILRYFVVVSNYTRVGVSRQCYYWMYETALKKCNVQYMCAMNFVIDFIYSPKLLPLWPQNFIKIAIYIKRLLFLCGIKSDAKTCKRERFFIVFAETTRYWLEKLIRSTSQKMLKRNRDIGRTYRSGSEKRKMKAVKENEIKRFSRAIKKCIVKKNSTEIEESESKSLSCLKEQDLHNLSSCISCATCWTSYIRSGQLLWLGATWRRPRSAEGLPCNEIVK